MRSAYLAGCTLMLAALFRVGSAQVEELREATGLPFAIDQSVIYGQVVIEGQTSGKKPVVNVSLITQRANISRTTINKSGYYFFRETPREGGTIVVEVDGAELGRQSILPSASKQQRYDFNIMLRPPSSAPKPGTVSAKHAYERSSENAKLLQKAAEAMEKGNADKSISYLKQVLENDPKDFLAWSLLGSVYFNSSKFPEAENAYSAALELKPDLTGTMVNLGKLYLSRKQYDSAVDILKKATQADPGSAISFRLLGEAYVYLQKGSLAVPALNEALRLSPVDMAPCHLFLAAVFDASGEENLAVAEYKAFLEKVPNYPDRAKIEKYISENQK